MNKHKKDNCLKNCIIKPNQKMKKNLNNLLDNLIMIIHPILKAFD